MNNSPYSVVILVTCSITCISMSVLIPQIYYGPTQFSYYSGTRPGLLMFLLFFCAACLPYIMLTAVAIKIRRLSTFANIVFCSTTLLLAGASLYAFIALGFPGGGEMVGIAVAMVLVAQVVAALGVLLLTIIVNLLCTAFRKLSGRHSHANPV
jgi:hypothetical protein